MSLAPRVNPIVAAILGAASRLGVGPQPAAAAITTPSFTGFYPPPIWRRLFLRLLTTIALALAGFGAGVPLGHAAATTATVASYDYDDVSLFAQRADRSTLRVVAAREGFTPLRLVPRAGVAAEAAPAIVRGGETAATAYGRAIHKTFDYGPGFRREFSLPSGRRADAVNLRAREIVELKPNNPRAIALGRRQLDRYASELEELYPGAPFTRRLETYDRP